MRYYETKIGKIIEEEFDSRMGNAVFAYITESMRLKNIRMKKLPKSKAMHYAKQSSTRH